MREILRRWLSVLLFMAGSASAFGDQIVKADGTRVDGRIVWEDADVLTIEVKTDGVLRVMPVAKTAIARIDRSSPSTRPSTQPATQPSPSPADAAARERREQYLADRKVEHDERLRAVVHAQEGRDEARRNADKARAEYMEKIGPELKELEAKIALAGSAGKAALDTRDDLNAQYADLRQDALDEYRESERSANGRGLRAADRAAIGDRNRLIRDRKLENLRLQFQPQIARVQERLNAAGREFERLQHRRQELLDAAPKVPGR